MSKAKAVTQTGPRTPAGKARSSVNATKHGILAAVAPHEAAAYADHLAAVRADLQPVGYLEEVLADRVALTLWRLGRVATFEAGQTAECRRESWERATKPSAYGSQPPLARIIDKIHPAGDHYPEGGAAGLVESLRGRVADCKRLEAICTKALDADDLGAAIGRMKATDRDEVALTAEAELERHGIDGYELREAAGVVTEGDHYSTAEALVVLEALARAKGYEGDDTTASGLWAVVYSLIREWRQAERDTVTAEAVAFETVAGAAIPKAQDLEKIAKYEAHLERVLYRAMHELEALQDKRAGKSAPMARVEVHGASA